MENTSGSDFINQYCFATGSSRHGFSPLRVAPHANGGRERATWGVVEQKEGVPSSTEPSKLRQPPPLARQIQFLEDLCDLERHIGLHTNRH
jgi:hypothetical protein